MKKIVLTFDDGRIDNYTNVFCLLKKYEIQATLFITTGYIDGSWKNNKWKSARDPLSIQHIKEMKKYGIEIALHGDRHTTNLDDFNVSMEKIKDWGLFDETGIGFSIPNSDVDNDMIKLIKDRYHDELLYVRGGRKCDTKKVKFKVLYTLSYYFHSQKAYNKFNYMNIVAENSSITEFVPSIVVKSKDRVEEIIGFVKQMPRDAICVLMFHSILDENDILYMTDSWCWSVNKFEKLCAALSNAEDVQVTTLKNLFIGKHIRQEGIKLP